MTRIILRVLLVFIFGLSFSTSLLFNTTPCLAATDEVKWSAVNIPVEGTSGKWVLATGSDVRYLTRAIDDTLYCYATPAGTTETLFKSIDGGTGWSATGKVTDVIIDIATLPQDAATIYYATASRVYRSTDAGKTFISLPANPGGAGGGNIQITSIDVVRSGNSNLVMVSTKDTDGAQYGGVYLLDESLMTGIWTNTYIGNFDVYRVAFSPGYTGDRLIIAIASDEINTVVNSKVFDQGWGQIIGNATINGVAPVSAAIAFPDDFSEHGNFFVALDTGTAKGDVYKITRAVVPDKSIAIDLGVGTEDGMVGVDISSLAISGNVAGANLLAGSSGSTQVYISKDGGSHWTHNQKPPTGQSQTCVLLTPEMAYAATCGTESAVSVSVDGGLSWNQTSLIDTRMSSLVDLAFTSLFSEQEPELFLLTFNSSNSKHSLWRSEDGGGMWQRVFCSNLPGVDSFNFVDTTPGSGNPQALFLAGQSNGVQVCWKSLDSGQTFSLRPFPFKIDAWAIVDSNTLFIGGFDGSHGLICRTINGGVFYSEPVEAGTKSLTTIVLSPDYQKTKTILAGNITGQIFRSNNDGVSFEQIGQQLPLTTGIGKVSLAFDSNFGKNQTVYSATDAKVITSSKERIFRFTIGKSSAWQGIYGTLPENAVINQMAISENGVLYATNSQGVVAADNKGGTVRTLNPATLAIETMLSGLDESVNLNGIWECKNRLWSIDTKNTRLMTVTDSLTTPVTLKSPPDLTSGLGTDLHLEWQSLSGATEYEWQVSDQTSFTNIPTGFTGTTSSLSASLTSLKPATTYYWRVRVTRPFLCPWSVVSSFTIALSGSNVAIELIQPEAGIKTPLKPVFQWQTVSGADRYELLVSTDTTFGKPAVSRTGELALPANAWLCETNLDYNTTYFWKVRACTASNFSVWSPVSAFTTEQAPVSSPPLREPDPEPAVNTTRQVSSSPNESQPSASPPVTNIQVNFPNWAIYTGLGLLLVIVLLVAVMLVKMIAKRRL